VQYDYIAIPQAQAPPTTEPLFPDMLEICACEVAGRK
jgi:hypothetical protein